MPARIAEMTIAEFLSRQTVSYQTLDTYLCKSADGTPIAIIITLGRQEDTDELLAAIDGVERKR